MQNVYILTPPDLWKLFDSKCNMFGRYQAPTILNPRVCYTSSQIKPLMPDIQFLINQSLKVEFAHCIEFKAL